MHIATNLRHMHLFIRASSLDPCMDWSIGVYLDPPMPLTGIYRDL